MIEAIAIVCVVIATVAVVLLKKNEPQNPMSFYESMKLVKLPVLTFKIGNEDINLLFDSGMMQSTIDSRVLELFKLPHKKHEQTFDMFGITGNVMSVPSVLMNLEYKGNVYEGHFMVQDLSGSMDAIKQEYGVRIHGALGTDFMHKYNYVVDFQKMMVYNKKSWKNLLSR